MIKNQEQLIERLKKTRSKKQLYVILYEKEPHMYSGAVYSNLGRAMQGRQDYIGKSIQLGNLICSNDELIEAIKTFTPLTTERKED